MRNPIQGLIVIFGLLSALSTFGLPPRPKLVLLIVIDQFRADYLTRFQDEFLPVKDKQENLGGFRFLMNQGAYFPYGTYDILQSMTGPGHATIVTGSYPYESGIALNYWFDSSRKANVYCTEDSNPTRLTGTTFGDELKNAGYPSRVVSVALKDRAAILMGGHRADFALWYDGNQKQWVSSAYYFKDGKLPLWITQANSELKVEPDSKASNEALETPAGLHLTEAMAERILDNMKMGQSTGEDFLAVSFSSHDYAGHKYGPNSPEMEKMTIAEDKEISKLLNYLNEDLSSGLKNVVVILTGDHGIPPAPDWAKENKLDAGTISEADLVKKMSSRLTEKFGSPSGDPKWVLADLEFNFYLNRAAIAEKHLDLATVENEAKSAIADTPGIKYVISSEDVRSRKLPPGIFERQILHTYYPGRSGDLILIPKPFYMPEGKDKVTHITGYNYDRTVPIILYGQNFVPGTYATKAEVIDIAPTIAFISGTIAPALSEGRVLNEAIAH